MSRETVTVQAWRRSAADHRPRRLRRLPGAEHRLQSGEEYLELSNLEKPLRPGEAIGDVDSDAIKRQMIRRTIEEHLDKELRLRPQGIKVLSLFFIDAVEHYRSYDRRRNPGEGQVRPDVRGGVPQGRRQDRSTTPSSRRWTWQSDATEVHDGYFSIDKKGAWTDTAENNQGNRDNAERAYNLIMKDKEKLLGFETKLKFIFSHSALREGWDNPNVFQICAIREMGTERERRQTIGRGLRLCVNQQGERAARLRRQHAHCHRHGRLRAVRRESPEGDRGGYRHPLRHRGEAPVRRHPGDG